MVKKSLKSLAEEVIALIPVYSEEETKEGLQAKEIIQSYESVLELLKKHEMNPSDLGQFLHYQEESAELREPLDKYFKLVHEAIRTQLKESGLKHKFLRAFLMNHFDSNSNYTFTKEQGEIALGKVLDGYDPNFNQKTIGGDGYNSNWYGMYTIIKIKAGEIDGMQMRHPLDLQAFHNALDIIQAPSE